MANLKELAKAVRNEGILKQTGWTFQLKKLSRRYRIS